MKILLSSALILLSFSVSAENQSPATKLFKKVVDEFNANCEPQLNNEEDRAKVLEVLTQKGYNVKESIDEDRAFNNFQRTCKICHSGANPVMNLSVPTDKAGMAKFAEHNIAYPDRTSMMRLHDETMPMEMELKPEERREMVIYLMKFLEKKN